MLFDGVCGLCSGLVQFLLRHDQRDAFRFAALQSDAGKAVLQKLTGTTALPSSFYVIGGYETDSPRVYAQSDGVLFVAHQLGWPWRAAAILRILPRQFRNWLYSAVARNRYRWFGRNEQCIVPPPQHLNRFIH